MLSARSVGWEEVDKWSVGNSMIASYPLSSLSHKSNMS